MSALRLLNGVITETPEKLTDTIKVAVPDNKTLDRRVYGPLHFLPVPSGTGGIRLPHKGDRAVVAIDEGYGQQWIISWYRTDSTAPPYPL